MLRPTLNVAFRGRAALASSHHSPRTITTPRVLLRQVRATTQNTGSLACVVRAHTSQLVSQRCNTAVLRLAQTAYHQGGVIVISIVDFSPDMPCHGIAQSAPVISSITLTKTEIRVAPTAGTLTMRKRAAAAHVENEGGILQETNLMPRQRSNALSFIMKVDSPYQDPGVIRRMQNFKFAEQDQAGCAHTSDMLPQLPQCCACRLEISFVWRPCSSALGDGREKTTDEAGE